MITPRMLLKSWAMPPASWPTLSSRRDWCELLLQRPLALALGAVADVADGGGGEDPVLGLDAGEADLDRELGSVLAHGVELDAGPHRPRPRLVEVARRGGPGGLRESARGTSISTSSPISSSRG